jgi:hypothetical protein
MGASSEPAAAGKHTGDDAHHDACAGKHRGHDTGQTSQSKSRQSGHSESHDPDRHETARHGLALGLRIQVRDDPPLRRSLTPSCNQVGILSEALAQ